jgi:hypothetical protein
MPPRRRAPTPIPIDVEAVRRKLADGKIVRVGISRSAQFPDGGTGRVRRVGDPAVDGEEFIQVELTLNGTKDTLPFTPSDLTPATRSTSSPPALSPRPASARAPSTKTATPPRARESQPRRPASVPAVQQTDSLFGDTGPTQPPTRSPEIVVTSSATPPTPPGPVTAATPPAAPTAPAARAANKPKAARGAKRPPSVAITIATTDTDPPQWRIEAKVGVRVVLRSGSVSPARVWELVGMLDDQTLTRAVGTILDDQRKAALARADQLTAELAQVRAELDALPGAR